MRKLRNDMTVYSFPYIVRLWDGTGSFFVGLGRVVLAEPIRVHVGRDVKHADVGEAHFLKRAVSGADVRTPYHGAAAAIDYEVGIFGEIRDGFLESFDALGLRAGAGIHRVGDVLVAIEHRKSHTQYRGRFGGLERLDQRRRLQEGGSGPGIHSVLTETNHGQESSEEAGQSTGSK
jgi:hypothetical protein